MSKLFVFLILLPRLEGTLDLNPAQLQFVANHLTPIECRRLAASLHFTDFDLPKFVEEIELQIPKDQTCMQLLLHWNSQKGEGRGETHELLRRRLQQIGKDSLSDWLGKKVFKEIGVDLKRAIDGVGEESTPSTTELEDLGPTLTPELEDLSPNQWTASDSILYVIALSLLVTTVIVGCRFGLTTQRRPYTKKIDPEDSDSEEERFNVRDHLLL